MSELDFYCSVWDADEQTLKEGPHSEVDTIILKDAYFVAGEISREMPNDQYISEKDLEMVDFTIDISGDEITADDVSSDSAGYLKKFSGIYEAVASYVEQLEHIPAERFQCPHCGNYLASGSDIGE